MTLFDFQKMAPGERVAYVREHGLSEEQRQELLRLNEIIATLLQQDAFWAHQREHFTVRMRFVRSCRDR